MAVINRVLELSANRLTQTPVELNIHERENRGPTDPLTWFKTAVSRPTSTVTDGGDSTSGQCAGFQLATSSCMKSKGNVFQSESKSF